MQEVTTNFLFSIFYFLFVICHLPFAIAANPVHWIASGNGK